MNKRPKLSTSAGCAIASSTPNQIQSDDGLFEMVPIAGRRDFTSKMLATLRHSPIDEPTLAKLGIHHSRPIARADIELTILAPMGDRASSRPD